MLKLFKQGTKLTRGFLPRHYNYAALDKDTHGFEELLIDFGHAEPLNKIDPRKKTTIEVLDNEALFIQQFQGCCLNNASLVSLNNSLAKRADLVSSVNEDINSAPNKPNALFTIFIFVVAIFFPYRPKGPQ